MQMWVRFCNLHTTQTSLVLTATTTATCCSEGANIWASR